MLSDIYINITILVSFLFLLGIFFKDKDFKSKQPIKAQVVIGMLFGSLGLMLMFYTIDVTKNVIIDLRNLGIISSAILGGPLAVLISSSMIAVFRVAYFGISKASQVAFSVAIIVGVACMLISLTNMKRLQKYLIMFFFAMVVSTMALVYLIPERIRLYEILLYYWPIYLIGAVLTYYAITYIIKTNLTYRNMYYNTLMADNLTDMLTTHSPDGSIITASPSSMNLLGYRPEELLGMNPIQLTHPEDRSITQESLSKHLSDLNYSPAVTVRMLKKDGTWIWAETTAKNIIGPDGSLKEIVAATRDITLRKNAEQEIMEAKIRAEKAASTDYLTGIMNRRAFVKQFEMEFQRAQREKYDVSLILADIDRFKLINDTYGHNNGDVVLQKFSDCLAKACRPYDFIGRHGGEEFIICLPNTSCEQATVVAERMRRSVEELCINFFDVTEPVRITASFGVTSYTINENYNTDALIMRVDKAMYKAKAEGRNRVCNTCE